MAAQSTLAALVRVKKLGKWSLIRKLGSGAFAEVWLALGPNRKNAPLVALKLVHSHLIGDEMVRSLLKDEAFAASLLSHPNVVEIYEVSAVQGRPYLAMEYIPGQSLYALLRKLSDRDEKFSIEEAAYAVNQSALGLHYAHEATGPDGTRMGLVHRDISPHNLIASDDGRVKVVDFGLAQVSATPGQTGEMEGKVSYMPPEQIRGDPVDRRVDTFALGAVLWELLAGQKLYPGKGNAELIQQALLQPPPDARLVFSHLPVPLADLIARSIARDKNARFQTALELAEALEPFITDDAADKLARRIQSHFEFMPRTKEEAMGVDRPKGPKRRTTVSQPRVATTAPPKKSGKTRRVPDPDDELVTDPGPGVYPSRKKKRGALVAVIVLSLLAIAAVALSAVGGKYITFPAPALPTEEELPYAAEEYDGGEEAVDAGNAEPLKKKPARKKLKDGGG